MANKIKLGLKEEVVDVKRRWVPTEEVVWHKEIVEEAISIVVPVKREVLVIERKRFDHNSADQRSNLESVRIPLREEKIEICKKPFTLEEVKIYKIVRRYNQPTAATVNREVMTVRHNHGQKIRVEENG